MLGLEVLTHAVGVELSRAITGRLFTEDQIRAVTKSTIGRYFADFLPEPADEKTARERVEEARQHIGKASAIIGQMQGELAQQSMQLDALLGEVEEKMAFIGKPHAGRGLPASFTPCSAKTFLARSIPTVRMAMTSPSE